MVITLFFITKPLLVIVRKLFNGVDIMNGINFVLYRDNFPSADVETTEKIKVCVGSSVCHLFDKVFFAATNAYEVYGGE